MAASDDSTLMKVAIFGITISLFCTLGVSLMLVETGDYSYDDISAYRNDLIAFSGESMVNDSPWVLTHVYTPWISGSEVTVDDDGWLYGSEITDYSIDGTAYIGEVANIRLDPSQKSSVPLNYTEDAATYTQQSGTEWWANIPVIGWIGTSLGLDPYTYTEYDANNWNFTGLRYTFDPVLPFKYDEETGEVVRDTGNTPSTVDGTLSLVWYNYNNTEGLSGGIDIYGGDILIGHYAATDIVTDYNSSSGYATVYDFDFNGVMLHLSILFDQDVIDSGTPLLQAWTNGDWTLAISSISAGNFLDITGSSAYSTSVGSMIDTFIQIFTFNVPDLDNEWASMILWLLCGLPMTIAMLCVTLRVIQVVKPSIL